MSFARRCAQFLLLLLLLLQDSADDGSLVIFSSVITRFMEEIKIIRKA
jgi:hypothetical protein